MGRSVGVDVGGWGDRDLKLVMALTLVDGSRLTEMSRQSSS